MKYVFLIFLMVLGLLELLIRISFLAVFFLITIFDDSDESQSLTEFLEPTCWKIAQEGLTYYKIRQEISEDTKVSITK